MRIFVLAATVLALLFPGLVTARPLVFDGYDQPGWFCPDTPPQARPCLFPLLTKALAERSGLVIRLEPVPVTRLGDRLRRGQSDFTLMARASEPEVSILEPVVDLPLLAIPRRQGFALKKYEDLYGLPLGVGRVRGARYNHPFDTDPRIHRIELSDGVLGLRQLAAGRLDAIVTTAISLSTDAHAAGVEDALGPRLVLGHIPFRLAVRADRADDPAVHALHRAIADLRADGSMTDIIARVTDLRLAEGQ